MRLRDLDIAIGDGRPGHSNAITDVPGIRVGHTTLKTGDSASFLSSGITAVIPYADKPKRFFAGRHALDGGDGFTGLGVTEDFGALSTPIVLAPTPAVGKVYDGLIRYGLGVAAGLPEDAGWPPVVIGVDDGGVNDPRLVHAVARQVDLDATLANARDGEVTEGAVGVGAGLISFARRGGVGTSWRVVDIQSGRFHVGVLVAANGGEPANLSVDGVPVGIDIATTPAAPSVPRTAVAVVATDTPCDPGQLDRLAGRAALGLTRVGLLDALTTEALVIVLSTSGLDDAKGVGGITSSLAMVAEEQLPSLFGAAAEACEEAVLNALLAAQPLSGEIVSTGGRAGLVNATHSLPTASWPQQVRAHRRRRGR